MATRVSGTWIGFLTMTFAIVGLTGLFATFAAPLPLQRALLRDAALDEALIDAQQADPAARLAALRPRLDDSAGVLDGDPAGLRSRVAAERAAMHARFAVEADVITTRLRVLIVVVTLAGAAFGAAVLGSVARSG